MNVILKTSVRLVMKPQAAYSGACNARVIVMRAASRPFFSIYLFSVKQSISLKHNSRVLRLKALAACQTSPILFKAFCTCCVSLPHSSAAAAPRCVHMSALLAFQLLPRAFPLSRRRFCAVSFNAPVLWFIFQPLPPARNAPDLDLCILEFNRGVEPAPAVARRECIVTDGATRKKERTRVLVAKTPAKRQEAREESGGMMSVVVPKKPRWRGANAAKKGPCQIMGVAINTSQ